MVSFIILNINTPELTQRCIASIVRNSSDVDYEIIVVDNNSTEENHKTLVSLVGEDCKVIRSKINTGFGLGNMLGALEAKGEYLCFLNSDVVFIEDCVSPLLRYLEEHKETGVITPQQYNMENRAVRSFKHALGIRHELLGDWVFEKLFPEKYPPTKDFSRVSPFMVPEINGCFMLFPSDVFFEIGGFDTNIFLYYEEYDIARRLEAKGYNNVVYPQSKFLHEGEVSSRKRRKEARKEGSVCVEILLL